MVMENKNNNKYDPKRFLKLLASLSIHVETCDDRIKREYKEGKITKEEAFLELI